MRYINQFILVFFCSSCFAQGLVAFQDFRKSFVVFDQGTFKTLEVQPVQKFGLGGNAIPYIDNLGFFKIYQNGKVYDITYGPNIAFTVTDNLIGYYLNEQLWVFDQGKTELLSVWVEDFKISDHTIAYTDNNTNSFNMYQNGEITKIEDVMSGINELDYQVGENIVAYVFQNEFKVRFLNETFSISSNNTPLSYKTGRNIVAYLDDNNNSFKVFYNGITTTLEEFHPTWYAVGDNIVLYLDQLDNLKVFSAGKTKSLSNGEVYDIAVQDNICSFVEQGQFKIFFKDQIQTLEYNKVNGTVLENNSVIYKDVNGSLKYFDGVQGKIITSERVSSFNVNINTIVYTNTMNRNRVFYQGRIY